MLSNFYTGVPLLFVTQASYKHVSEFFFFGTKRMQIIIIIISSSSSSSSSIIIIISGAPCVSKSTHPRKFGDHVTVHRPFVRTTGKPMFNFTLSSSFGSIGKLMLHTYCTSMLWSTDRCQTGRLLTSITWPYRGLRCRPIEVECIFLKLSADKLLVFKWSQPQLCFLKINMKYVVF